MSRSLQMAVGIILGVILLIVAYVYFSHTAGNLPAYFPGHEAGSAVTHTKHGIAALLLGVACFVYAWFQSGSKKAQ